MTSLNILVAEDESLIRLGLTRILEEAGHTVTAVADGEAALARAAERTPDLAILDIRMPRLDGLAAAERLYAAAPIPIIFLTAYGERDLVERAAKLPILGYLVKPLKEAELHAMIAVARQRFAEHAEVRHAAAESAQALAADRAVARAKGLLMRHEGLSAAAATRRLEELARRERRTLLEVAAALGADLDPQGR